MINRRVFAQSPMAWPPHPPSIDSQLTLTLPRAALSHLWSQHDSRYCIQNLRIVLIIAFTSSVTFSARWFRVLTPVHTPTFTALPRPPFHPNSFADSLPSVHLDPVRHTLPWTCNLSHAKAYRTSKHTCMIASRKFRFVNLIIYTWNSSVRMCIRMQTNVM